MFFIVGIGDKSNVDSDEIYVTDEDGILVTDEDGNFIVEDKEDE